MAQASATLEQGRQGLGNQSNTFYPARNRRASSWASGLRHFRRSSQSPTPIRKTRSKILPTPEEKERAALIKKRGSLNFEVKTLIHLGRASDRRVAAHAPDFRIQIIVDEGVAPEEGRDQLRRQRQGRRV